MKSRGKSPAFRVELVEVMRQRRSWGWSGVSISESAAVLAKKAAGR
jgi:hypothetical protein